MLLPQLFLLLLMMLLMMMRLVDLDVIIWR